MVRYGITATCHMAAPLPGNRGELIAPLLEALIERGGEDVAVSTEEAVDILEIDVSVVAENVVRALDKAVVIVGGAIIDTGGTIENVEKQIPPGLLEQDRAREQVRASQATVRAIAWNLDPDENALSTAR